MHLFLLCLFILVIVNKSANPVDPKANEETKCLFQHLYNLSHSSQNGFIFGHHHDNFEGQHFIDHSGLQNKSDVLSDVNYYPGFIEYSIQTLLNGADFSNHILSAISNGLMVGWHYPANNPVTGGSHKDTTGDPIVQLMPGNSANKNWTRALDKFATFVKSIKMANGHQIPMLMRLFHENLGSWNWWGVNSSTPKQYIAAYNYTRWYLVENHDLHNMLFVYAPDKPSNYYGNDADKYINDRYPGNDVIDIVAFDCYEPDDFHVQLLDNVELVVEVSNKLDKIAAIGEFGVKNGIQNTNVSNWYMSAFYNPLMGNDTTKKIAYAQTWTDGSADTYWIPIKGQLNYDGFQRFYQQNKTIFQNNMPDVYYGCK